MVRSCKYSRKNNELERPCYGPYNTIQIINDCLFWIEKIFNYKVPAKRAKLQIDK